jgi:hypothetical protein
MLSRNFLPRARFPAALISPCGPPSPFAAGRFRDPVEILSRGFSTDLLELPLPSTPDRWLPFGMQLFDSAILVLAVEKGPPSHKGPAGLSLFRRRSQPVTATFTHALTLSLHHFFTLSLFHCSLSTVHCPPFTVHCLLFSVDCHGEPNHLQQKTPLFSGATATNERRSSFLFFGMRM